MTDHSQLQPQTIGVLLSMLIAVLRLIYDCEETRPVRILLESVFCGSLSLAAYYGILAMGLDVNWSVFTGGVIGYFGSTTVKLIAYDVISRKANKRQDSDE